jgi:ligand-binding sensor domain-containing protein/serine phosphatase RsbU (regulator of sigma subunit)
MKQFKFLFIIPILLWSLNVVAQNSNFTEYMIEDGLIMSQIESIVQDNDGNLWIGTIGGLSKYNGTEFANYTQKEGLAEDWVSVCYFSTKSNTLWLGHRGGGVSIKKEGETKFTDLVIEKYTKYNLINDITEDQDGNVLIAVENLGVLHYNVETDEIVKVKDISATHINTLEVDQNNILWVGTEKGIYYINAKTLDMVYKLSADKIGDDEINQVKVVFENEMWVSTGHSGVVRYKVPANETGYKNLESKSLTMEDGVPSNNIYNVYEDHYHNVWIATHKKGILQYKPKNYTGKSSDFIQGGVTIFSNKFEMKYYQANTFFEDREGIMWMGTEFGLLKYMGELFKIYDQHDDLINNLVWSILEDNEGSMWYGTSKGVSRFQFPFVNGEKQYHNPKVTSFTTKNGLPENIVISMFQDKKGTIWMGTENSGVFTISKEGKILKTYNEANGLSNNKVFCIEEDKEGNVWLGTKNGISIINVNTGSVSKVSKISGLGGDKVYSLFRDSKDNMWIGILGGNLTMYDGKSYNQFSAKEGVPEKFIISIAEDSNNNLWFAAYSDGVLKYDGKSFKKYSLEEGLKSNSIHFITCDNDNNVWIGQSVGIEKFDPKSEQFSFYGRQQGFVGMETNENAVYKDIKGNIWFGTLRGVVKFNPSKEEKNVKEPLTKINSMNVFMDEVQLEDGATFSYDKNYLTFNYKGICLKNANEVYYKYRLEGLNDEWSKPVKTSQVTFPGLSHGKYKFSVLASNNNGIWNKEPVTYSFKVTPPFWKTWWFYTLDIIVILGAIILVVKGRERKLLKNQEKLEREVQLRTEELQKEKEVVEKQNKNITESIGYARRIQDAILPPKQEIDKMLNESFILYEPKDVVSGDFYWMHKKGDKTFVAAVDCTGHGVPGAFMSLIGYNLLEKVVNESDNVTPSDLLNKLSVEITRALRQDGAIDSVKDGMDISICSVDFSKKELDFAGAYNPMYLVRKGELTEYKADKVPIGKGTDKGDTKFVNQKINLETNDVIYMFSDGYADQKGGVKKKKYYYKPFREYLVSIADLPLDEQKQKLSSEFANWRGDVIQIDDVLVLGFKI